MNCPKCDSAFEKIFVETIELDRCTNCKGIWFDSGELKEILKIKNSEKVDIGDQKVGKRNDNIKNVRCPKCNQIMAPMVDLKQSHIWYEYCGSCGGVYLDAGELKDLKEINIFDKIKNIIKGERKLW